MSLEGTSLSTRLASLRETHDIKVTGDDTTRTPLWVFLRFVVAMDNSRNYDPNLNYGELRELYNYFKPLKLPDYSHIKGKIPRLIQGHELATITTMITSDDEKVDKTDPRGGSKGWGARFRDVFFCMQKEVIPLLYRESYK